MKKLVAILLVITIFAAGISVYAYSGDISRKTENQTVIDVTLAEDKDVNEDVEVKQQDIINPTHFVSQKDEIIYKMLNSIDYFNTATVEFSALFPSFSVAQDYYIETNIDTGVSHQICSDNFVETRDAVSAKAYETYSDGKVVREYNNMERSVRTLRTVEERRTLAEEWPGIEERYYIDENEAPHYRYRGNPTNADMAGECLFPQVAAFAYLVDKSLWSVVKSLEYCERECYFIEGTVRDSYSEQIGADTFMMYVDKETGVLLKLEAYDSHGNIVSSMVVSSISIDEPMTRDSFTYDMSKYESYTDLDSQTNRRFG